jgi:hypothetical protein
VWHYCSGLFFEVDVEHAKDMKIRALPPIGMKFVKMKEATLSHIVAGSRTGALRSTISHPDQRLGRAHVISNAPFEFKQTNLSRPMQADVD